METDTSSRLVVFPRSCPGSVAASAHVASRVLFPAYLAPVDDEIASSQSSTHAFDAVYRNAMDYLDKINHEDGLQ